MEQRAVLTPYLAAADSEATPGSGLLIVNADDWGRNSENTDRILECVLQGAVSSTSAMVYMEDSERAARIARERGVDAGLHLNLTTSFSAAGCSALLTKHHYRVSRYLAGNRLAQVIYHPGLADSFEYMVRAQLEEFSRLYGREPERIDGHHHMHLCANVLLGKLLPAGIIVRRNFSFSVGKKSWGNRLYRRSVDRMLAKRHSLTDFFYALTPLEPASRLEEIFSLARRSVVEVETHPINSDEYRFLTSGEILRLAEDVPVATRYAALERAPRTE
jgi:predicted glycoside hydrolase/deacetylase ChbG (UPF0249 family)